MVEFALVLPILLTMLYGMMEVGRLLFIFASTVTAARQAARSFSMNRAEIGLKVTPPSPHSRPIALRRNYDVLRHITLGVIRRRVAGDREFQERDAESIWRGEANCLEALAGDRLGQYSIRVNQQWRICFRWTDRGPTDVEIVDYHP